MAPDDEPAVLRALDEDAQRAQLCSVEALALHVLVADLLEQSRSYERTLSWRVTRGMGDALEVALMIRLPLRGDRADAICADALRFPSFLDVEVDRLASASAITIRITAAPSGLEDAAKGATGERALRLRAGAVLSELERRNAELEHMRDELDETNRGVVALYAELDNHSRELELADRRKNEYLAMLAHELRNPLAALQLGAEDLSRGDATAAVRIMSRQIHHLKRMVDDLLDVSRITRGKVEIDAHPMDLVQAIRLAIEPRRVLASEIGHEVELRLPDEPIFVSGDATRIEQVLVNLFDNALKYTAPPGRITVEVTSVDGSAEVVVRDTGRGMTEDQIRDAFDLFVQHGERLDRSTGGLGIGLTLVREIVRMHGGSVRAESPGLGLGTTLRVALPIVAEAAPAEITPLARAKDADGLRVLLVEDNEDFRELLAARLRRKGYAVEEASDGSQALARLEHGALPGVVVTDVGLPGMDGYELARAVRKNPRLRSMRLIALTGYGGEAAALRTRNAGFDAHLVKPVSLDELLVALA